MRTTPGEIERILSNRTVIGEPIIVEGNTIIPRYAWALDSGGLGVKAGIRLKAAAPASVEVAE